MRFMKRLLTRSSRDAPGYCNLGGVVLYKDVIDEPGVSQGKTLGGEVWAGEVSGGESSGRGGCHELLVKDNGETKSCRCARGRALKVVGVCNIGRRETPEAEKKEEFAMQ